MKRIIVLLLALSLLVSSASAIGNARPAETAPEVSAPPADQAAAFDLDAAFAAGSVALVETKAAGIAISANAVELPDAMWTALGVDKPADPAAYVAAALEASAPELLSLSPAGNSGLFDLGGTGVAWYDGVFHPIYPNESRGVKDVNENLKFVATRGIRIMLNDEGVVYSHDGRYAFIPNVRMTLLNGRFVIDPYLIDLSTGEMFLLATYGNKPMEDGFSVVTTACFSADDRYFTYALYGDGADKAQLYRTGIYQCDLETREVSFLASGSDFNYWPGLYETAGGSYLILRDAIKGSEHTGVTLIKRFAGKWICEEKGFDIQTSLWSPRSLLYSPASGYAVVRGMCQAAGVGGSLAFQCFRPDDGFAGLNTYYIIGEDGKITALTGEAYVNMLKDAASETPADDASNQEVDSSRLPCRSLLRIRLSPDGRYALIFSAKDGKFSLQLVRLEDMATVPVTGLDAGTILPDVLGRAYPPTIEWNNDNLIIITDTGIRTFRMAAGTQ